MWLYEFLARWENTILVPERKSSAPGMIDTLIVAMVSAGINPTKRIFHRNTQDYDRTEDEYKEYVYNSGQFRDPKYMNKYRDRFGFNTTAATRKDLYGNVLTYAMELAIGQLNSVELINELLALQIKNSRIDHPDGGHDDSVIAWMLAMWFILYGKNLDFYGLSNRKALRKQAGNVDETEEEYEELMNQIDEIRGLLKELSRCKCPYTKLTLERQVRNLLKYVEVDTSKAKSLSELEELLGAEKLKRGYS